MASALKLEADLDDTTEESPVFQGLMKRVPSLFSASARKEGMKLVQILRAADPQARRNLYDSSPLKALRCSRNAATNQESSMASPWE